MSKTVEIVPAAASLPSRVVRRARRDLIRLDDAARDVLLGIRTCPPPVSGPPDPEARNARHEALSYAALAHIRSHLPLDAGDVFYDIGCGYGRAVCYFARQRIRKSIGLELLPDLAQRAAANAARLRGKIAEIEIRTGDAGEQAYAEGTVFFLYNPFSAAVMATVLERIERGRAGRPIRIVYANPVARHVMDQASWLVFKTSFQVPYGGGYLQTCLWETRPA